MVNTVCIIGSPPCTAFSPLHEIGRKKRDPAAMKRELEEGKRHMRFCLEIYMMQIREHRHFVHEHPERSKAWQMKEIVGLVAMPEVGTVDMHMCVYGCVSYQESLFSLNKQHRGHKPNGGLKGD